ncbi:MAG: hypothetical protein ACUVTQ_06530, partial [Desulfotomaculales bacterium]
HPLQAAAVVFEEILHPLQAAAVVFEEALDAFEPVALDLLDAANFLEFFQDLLQYSFHVRTPC